MLPIQGLMQLSLSTPSPGRGNFSRSDTPFVCRPRASSVECRMAGRACLCTAGPGHGGA